MYCKETTVFRLLYRCIVTTFGLQSLHEFIYVDDKKTLTLSLMYLYFTIKSP